MRKLAHTLVPLFLLACRQQLPTAAPHLNFSVTESTNEMYRLVGQGNYYEAADPDIVIQAIRHFDGHIAGEARDPRWGALGPVLGVTPPSAAYPHWCAEVDLAGAGVPGFIALVYVRDNDGRTALDEIAVGGDFGATCQLYPTPFEESDWRTLVSGDFQGVVRTR